MGREVHRIKGALTLHVHVVLALLLAVVAQDLLPIGVMPNFKAAQTSSFKIVVCSAMAATIIAPENTWPGGTAPRMALCPPNIGPMTKPIAFATGLQVSSASEQPRENQLPAVVENAGFNTYSDFAILSRRISPALASRGLSRMTRALT